MSIKTIILAVAASFSLAACGATVGQQSAGGGAIGAGLAALTGGNLAKGAAIGAAGNVLYCGANPGACN
jgi:hypothetical protein